MFIFITGSLIKIIYNLFSEMHITLHLAFTAVIGFAVSDARQQQHDIGKIYIHSFFKLALLRK